MATPSDAEILNRLKGHGVDVKKEIGVDNAELDDEAILNKLQGHGVNTESEIGVTAPVGPSAQGTPSDVGALERIGGFARGLGSGATMGASELALAGGYAGLSPDVEFPEAVEKLKAQRERTPGEYEAGELVGSIAPFTPTAKVFSKAAGMAEKGYDAAKAAIQGIRQDAKIAQGIETAGEVGRAAGELYPQAAQGLQTVKDKVAKGGLSAAAGALAVEGIRKATLESSGLQNTPSLGQTGVIATGMGLGLPAAGALIRGGASAGKFVAKKMAASMGGVPESAIDHYMMNPAAVNNAKSTEELSTLLHEKVSKLKDDVDSSKMNVEAAKEKFKELKDQYLAVEKERNFQASDDLAAAKESLDAAILRKEEEIRLAANIDGDMIDDILDSVDAVKAKLISESDKALELLNASSEKIATKPIADHIKRRARDLNVEGQTINPQDEAAQKALLLMAKKVSKMRDFIPLTSAKELVKDLDQMITYSGRHGEFSKKGERALIEVRRALHVTLGELVDPYKKAMENVVAPLGDLRARASERLGTVEGARQRLLAVHKPGFEKDLELIVELGERTGKDFLTPLLKITENKGLLGSKLRMENMRQSLPEQQQVMVAQGIMSQLRKMPPLERAKVMAELEREKIIPKMLDLQLETAREILAPFQSWGGEQAIRKINALARNKDPQLIAKFKKLSEMSDIDFERAAKDAMVSDSFEKAIINGSRSVNLWGGIFRYLGAGAGYLLGDATGTSKAMGAGLGGIVGVLMEQNGTAITKKILDGMIQIKGIPTIQKINKLSIDPAAKKVLSDSLIRAVATGREGKEKEEDSFIEPEVKTSYIDLIKESDMSPVEKAKAISKINKEGLVSPSMIRELMIGKQEEKKKSDLVPEPKPKREGAMMEDMVERLRLA